MKKRTTQSSPGEKKRPSNKSLCGSGRNKHRGHLQKEDSKRDTLFFYIT